MRKKAIDNVVDYDELDSFLARKMKWNLLDHTFPLGSKYGRWSTIAPCHVQRTGGGGSDHYTTSFCLQVEALDGKQHGEFSPEATPYQAVLTGIQEYIEYMTDKQP